MTDCIFCKIVKKEAPSSIEFEDENVVGFRSINSISEVHILIAPKKHINTFLDINDDVILKMTQAAQQIIKDNKIEDGYKLVFNGGKYQTVGHLHWHLLGGKLEDENDVLNKT